MKILGAVLDRIGDAMPYASTLPLRLTELELRDPEPGELCVRIDAAGICHSDLSVVNGDRARPTPMLLGHEAAATVERVGDKSLAFSPGDKVVLAFLAPCGQCASCGAGRGYLCEPAATANAEGRLQRGGTRLSERGLPVHHHLGVSAFATHAVIDARSAVKVPKDIPSEIAALFGCAVLTGVGAVLNSALVRPGESVAVFGLGGVGMAAILGAVLAGAYPIIAIDPVAEKRQLARALGAAAVAEPDQALAVIEATSPRGVDAAIETAGRAAVLQAAYQATRRGGRTVSVGLPNPRELISLSPVSMVGESRTLMGSYMGSSIPVRDIPNYIRLWQAGRLPVERLLSAVRPLSHINTLLDELAAGSVLRQVVRP